MANNIPLTAKWRATEWWRLSLAETKILRIIWGITGVEAGIYPIAFSVPVIPLGVGSDPKKPIQKIPDGLAVN